MHARPALMAGMDVARDPDVDRIRLVLAVCCSLSVHRCVPAWDISGQRTGVL